MEKKLDVDGALAAVRVLAEKVVASHRPGRCGTVWETVRAMEEGQVQALDLARAVQELDAYATEHHRAPREWRLGRELTPEAARDLIGRHPDIAPLGEALVISLARQGFGVIQMMGIVRQVRAGATVQQ